MSVYKAPKFVKFRNVSKNRVRIPDLGVDIAAGEECHIQEGYGMPRVSHAGERFPSVIEFLAGCGGCEEQTVGKFPDGSPNHKSHCLLEPVEDSDKERFSKAPDADAPSDKPKMPSVSSLVAAGIPRGVAEQLVKAAYAAVQITKDGIVPAETEGKAKGKKKETSDDDKKPE